MLSSMTSRIVRLLFLLYVLAVFIDVGCDLAACNAPLVCVCIVHAQSTCKFKASFKSDQNILKETVEIIMLNGHFVIYQPHFL